MELDVRKANLFRSETLAGLELGLAEFLEADGVDVDESGYRYVSIYLKPQNWVTRR